MVAAGDLEHDSRLNDKPHNHWRDQLDDGLAAMSIHLDGEARERLLAYLALLQKWNRAYNLTAVRDPQRMVSRQLLDSLAVLPWLRGPRILDVGTGAGLPGIPLAIARPQWRFTLLDANGKKTRFVRQVKNQLDLTSVTVLQTRVESLNDDEGFDSIVSRAFSALPDFIRSSRTVLAPRGRWLALKSAAVEDELVALKRLDAELDIETLPLDVPGETADRRVVLVSLASSDGNQA